MGPHTKEKEQAPVTLTKASVEKNLTGLGEGREGKKMADRTQHEGKTERTKESHDRSGHRATEHACAKDR